MTVYRIGPDYTPGVMLQQSVDNSMNQIMNMWMRDLYQQQQDKRDQALWEQRKQIEDRYNTERESKQFERDKEIVAYRQDLEQKDPRYQAQLEAARLQLNLAKDQAAREAAARAGYQGLQTDFARNWANAIAAKKSNNFEDFQAAVTAAQNAASELPQGTAERYQLSNLISKAKGFSPVIEQEKEYQKMEDAIVQNARIAQSLGLSIDPNVVQYDIQYGSRPIGQKPNIAGIPGEIADPKYFQKVKEDKAAVEESRRRWDAENAIADERLRIAKEAHDADMADRGKEKEYRQALIDSSRLNALRVQYDLEFGEDGIGPDVERSVAILKAYGLKNDQASAESFVGHKLEALKDVNPALASAYNRKLKEAGIDTDFLMKGFLSRGGAKEFQEGKKGNEKTPKILKPQKTSFKPEKFMSEQPSTWEWAPTWLINKASGVLKPVGQVAEQLLPLMASTPSSPWLRQYRGKTEEERLQSKYEKEFK